MELPDDVLEWIRGVFAEANLRASEKLSNLPTCHEPWLDVAVIEAISQAGAPRVFASGHVVRLETHFLGGYPLYDRWEIADIGLHIQLRRAGAIEVVKIALLQSKRLYPEEEEADTLEHERLSQIGFGRALVEPPDQGAAWGERTFTLTEDSQYKELRKADEQSQRIEAYETENGVPVHYLFYNPVSLPWRRRFPASGDLDPDVECPIGARVRRASDVRELQAGETEGASPSYSGLFSDGPGWRLEDFVVNEVLACNEGYQAESIEDESLRRAFFDRTAPISAALTIVIDAPEE